VPRRKRNTSPFCSQELWPLDLRGGRVSPLSMTFSFAYYSTLIPCWPLFYRFHIVNLLLYQGPKVKAFNFTWLGETKERNRVFVFQKWESIAAGGTSAPPPCPICMWRVFGRRMLPSGALVWAECKREASGDWVVSSLTYSGLCCCHIFLLVS
jgi:hypothetical protein